MGQTSRRIRRPLRYTKKLQVSPSHCPGGLNNFGQVLAHLRFYNHALEPSQKDIVCLQNWKPPTPCILAHNSKAVTCQMYLGLDPFCDTTVNIMTTFCITFVSLSSITPQQGVVKMIPCKWFTLLEKGPFSQKSTAQIASCPGFSWIDIIIQISADQGAN